MAKTTAELIAEQEGLKAKSTQLTLADSASTRAPSEVSTAGLIKAEELEEVEEDGKLLRLFESIGVETGGSIGLSGATLPLLAGGPVGWGLYIAANGLGNLGLNYWAQSHRDPDADYSWEEGLATAAISTATPFIPALKVAQLSRRAQVAAAAGEGAVMGSVEEGLRQSLEMASGKREAGEYDVMSLGFATAAGTTFGGTMGYAVTSAPFHKLGTPQKDLEKINEASIQSALTQIDAIDNGLKQPELTDADRAGLLSHKKDLEDKISAIKAEDRRYLTGEAEKLGREDTLAFIERIKQANKEATGQPYDLEAGKVIDLGEPQVEGADVIPGAPEQPKGVDFAPLVTDKPFFIYQDGVRYGGRMGFGRQQLETFISEGRLKPDAKIAQIGDKEWFNLSELSKEAPGVEKVETGVPEALATKEDVERVGNVWNQLSQEEDLFRKPTSSKETLEDVFSDLEVEGWNITSTIEQKADGFYRLNKDKDPNDWATVDVGAREIEITSIGARGGAEDIYQAALQLAHNTGKKYVPDAELTRINEVRTISAMFSSALKNKSTKHFELQQKHRDYLKLSSKDMYFGRDYETDLKYLAQIEKDIVADRLSEIGIGIENLEYDFNTDKFYKVEGTGEQETRELLEDADIVELIKDADPYFEEGVGLTTFKRAVVTDTTMRGPRPGFRGEGRKQFDVRESLQKIFPAPTTAGDLDVRFTGPKKAGIAQEFKEKTLIEGVGQRMQTDNPVTAREALQELVDKTGGRLGQYQPVIDRLLALGKGTGIDAKLETRAAASEIPEAKTGSFYESGKRRIVFDGDSSSFQQNPVYELLHESTHAVTVDNVNKYFDADSFNTIDINDVGARAAAIDKVLKKRLPKPVAEMFRMFKKADSMRDEIIAKGDLKTVAGEADTYWIKNPAEFMSMAFSDPVVQRALKGIEYDPKMSMWDKVVDTVKRLLGKGVTNDLADSIVTRVGEIAEMRLPTQRGRGTVDFGPGGEPLTPEQRLQALDRLGMSDEDLSNILAGKSEIIPINLASFTTDQDVQRSMAGILEQLTEKIKTSQVKTDKESLIQQVTELRKKLDPELDEEKFVQQIAKESEDIIFKTALADSMTFSAMQGWFKKIDANTDLNDPAVATSLIADMDRLQVFLEASSTISSSAGKLLQSRKITKEQIAANINSIERQARKAEKDIVEDLVKYPEELNPTELKEQLEKLGGLKNVRSILNEIKLVKSPEKLGKLLEISKRTTGEKFGRIAKELIYDGVLSAPPTQAAAASGNAMMTLYSLFNQGVGGLATGNLEQSRMALRTTKYIMYGLDDAFQAAKIAAANSQGEMSLKSHYEKIGEKAFAMEATGLSGPIGETVENIGELLNFGPKGLVFQDEFYRHLFGKAQARALLAEEYKQLVKRGEAPLGKLTEYMDARLARYFVDGKRFKTKPDVEIEAATKAREQGLNVEESKAFMEEYVRDNWTNKLASEIEYMRDFGDKMTFQRELSDDYGVLEAGAKKLGELRQKSSVLELVQLFLRTPTNMFMELGGTLSGGLLLPGMDKITFKRTLEELRSDNPSIRAQARGRQIVGAGLWASALYLADQGIITGEGPRDYKERETKMNTGWEPHAINLSAGKRHWDTGDAGGEQKGDYYLPLTRLGSIADVYGVSATLLRAHEDNSMPDEELDKAISSLQLALTTMITDKTYLMNISELNDGLFRGKWEEDGKSGAFNLFNAMNRMAVPSIMKAASQLNDPYLRQINEPMEQFKLAFANTRRELDPKRDELGLPKLASPYNAIGETLNYLSPMRVETLKSRKATKEDVKKGIATKVGQRLFTQQDEARMILDEIGGGFKFSRPTDGVPGLDLRKLRVQQDYGFGLEQTLYDRWQQIYSELNPAEAIIKAYNKPQFQRMGKVPKGSPVTNARKTSISSALRALRNKALGQLVKENPELKAQYYLLRDLTKKTLMEGETAPRKVVAPELAPLLD